MLVVTWQAVLFSEMTCDYRKKHLFPFSRVCMNEIHKTNNKNFINNANKIKLILKTINMNKKSVNLGCIRECA